MSVSNQFSEEHLLRTASSVCSISPSDILLIGGGLVLSKLSGYKRLRKRSDDLDFIVNDNGIQMVSESFSLRQYNSEGCSYSFLNGVLIGFFHKTIRGYEIPQRVFDFVRKISTIEGDIYAIPQELNFALKIRRGASKNPDAHIYGKDGHDFASVITGLYLRGEEFNTELWVEFMKEGVCRDCNLRENYACLSGLRQGHKNLKAKYKENFQKTIKCCQDSIEGVCLK